MINSVDQYEFVTGVNIDAEHPHGDLDRILINGEIMPLRSEDHKRDIRGEDIVFLYEAVCERYRAVGHINYLYPFNRDILKGNLIPEIDFAIYDLIGTTGSWIKNDAVLKDGFEDPITDDKFYTYKDYERIEYPLKSLEFKNIETMFDGLGKLNRPSYLIFPGEYSYPDWTYDIESRGSERPEEPSYPGYTIYESGFTRSPNPQGDWYTQLDYDIKATSAKVVFDKEKISSRFGINLNYLKKVDVWLHLNLQARIITYGYHPEMDRQYRGEYWKKFTLNLRNYTIDLSPISSMAEDLLKKIGYTPQKPEIDSSYFEISTCTLATAAYYFVGELRDRTRW